MAQLDEMKVKMGYLIKMSNEQQKFGEANEYYALKIEDIDGGNERWLLLTTHEVDNLKPVYIDGFDMKFGQMHLFRKGDKSSYIVRIKTDSSDIVVMISQGTVNRGLTRANKNPEDIPHQSALADMLD